MEIHILHFFKWFIHTLGSITPLYHCKHHIATRCTYHITYTCIALLYHKVNTYIVYLYIISPLHNIANTCFAQDQRDHNCYSELH